MSIDVQVLINQVKPILAAVIAQDVVLLVRISKLQDLATDQVADATPDVDEDEAVAGDPRARLDSLRVFVHKVESLFKSVVHIFLLEDTLGDSLVHSRCIEF